MGQQHPNGSKEKTRYSCLTKNPHQTQTKDRECPQKELIP